MPISCQLLHSAGYNVAGVKLQRDKRRFKTPECAQMRFSLLSEDCQKAVGSPERLQEIERQAMSELARMKPKGIKGGSLDALIAKGIAESRVPNGFG